MYIYDNNLLFDYQFGFQEGKSTHLGDDVSRQDYLDQGASCVGMFVDFLRLNKYEYVVLNCNGLEIICQ